jgi:hypothetical protein
LPTSATPCAGRLPATEVWGPEIVTFRSLRVCAQALVESALVFPLVITLSLGVLQVVLYSHARDVLITAVQEGARLAAEDGRAPEEGIARAQSLAFAGLGRSVEPLSLHAFADDQVVTVEVDAALRPILPLPGVTGLPLHAVGRVARERFRPGGGG